MKILFSDEVNIVQFSGTNSLSVCEVQSQIYHISSEVFTICCGIGLHPGRGKYIDLLVWSGSSPDLNVIENCWTILKRMIPVRHLASMDDLNKVIWEVWVTEITEKYCENSMPKRILGVLNGLYN